MTKENFQKVRTTIGFFINQVEGRGISPLLWGAADVAEEHDVNLVVFAGKSIRSPFEDEIQFNSVYQMASVERLDGVIISSGTLACYVGMDELSRFLDPFRSVPIVSISLALDGVPSVIVDNLSGMRDAVEHLIVRHNYRRIAFLRGPETNPEAQDRYQAYRDVLGRYRIPLDPQLVVQGDFRFTAGQAAIRELMDERRVRFDALVCANDDMAHGAFVELQSRMIGVPKDVAVTGFDDIEDIKYLAAPLTTVHQPLYEQGRKSVELLLSMIRGKDAPGKVSLPTSVAVRQSCGCMNLSEPRKIVPTDIVPDGDFNKAIEDVVREKRKDIIIDSLEILDVPDEDKKKYLILIDTLLDALANDIQTRFETRLFLETINSVLSKDLVTDEIRPQWNRTLSGIASAILKNLRDWSTLYNAQEVFQSAHILITDILYRREFFLIQQAYMMFWDLRSIIHRINSCFDNEILMDVVAEELPRVGLQGCSIAFYEKADVFKNGQFVLPDYARLRLANDPNGRIQLEDMHAVFPTRRILPDWHPVYQRRHTLILLPLFFEKDHFGYIVFELGPREEILYETLRRQISSAIKGAKLFSERQDAERRLKTALRELERSNRELHGLSIRDELTGLYNRRGLYVLGEQHFKLTQRNKGKFVLFFADLDGLKSINDSFGHTEGDEAIRNAARLLKKTFREADILGRFGGDEYVVLAVGCRDPKADIQRIKTRLIRNLVEFNRKSRKPYPLSVSLGSAIFDYKKAKTFEELMVDADRMLYEQKREKNSRRRKASARRAPKPKAGKKKRKK